MKSKKKKVLTSFSDVFLLPFPIFHLFFSIFTPFPFFPCLFFPDTSAKISRSEVSGGALCPPCPPACYATGAPLDSAPLDSDKFAKNQEKEVENQEKLWKKRKNGKERANIGKVLSLCLSLQIGLATLLQWRHSCRFCPKYRFTVNIDQH